MAYSTHTDVRLHAPQAPAGENFAGYIEQADRVIDARLRTVYELPFASTPGLIVNVSSKLAAAEFLKARYGALNQDPPDQANRLYREALDDLAEIVANPNLIDATPRETDAEDEDRDEVDVAGEGRGVFGMGDERTWG